MIKGVIFDLDGVITDTAEFHYLAWKKLCNEELLKFDKLMNEELKGVSRVKSIEIILAHNNKSISKIEKENYLERKNNYYIKYLEQISEKDYLPGIKGLLQELKSSEIKVGLGSASKNAISVLSKLNATQYFDVIGDGNSVVNGKPAPDLFLFVAKELGLSSQECVVVEDAAPGVQAALDANMKAIGIGEESILVKATVVLKNTQLLKLKTIQNI